MDERKRVIYGLILAGVFFIGTSFIFSTFEKPQQNLMTPQARLISLGNGVKVIRKSLSPSIKANERASHLYLMDTVETDADSIADIELPDGHRFQMGSLSRITLDRHEDKIDLIVHSGTLTVDEVGANPVLISENGMSTLTSEYQKKSSIKEPKKSPVLSVNEKKEVQNQSSKENRPPQEYVENTLQHHKKHFYKCYSQLLEKKPGLTGQASLRFTIERNGKVRSPEISFCSIKDYHFRKCLVEALRRIEFHAYRGEPINTFFPLKFE